jgi:hypothetical protein
MTGSVSTPASPRPGIHVAGYLHAAGDFVTAHRREIEATLRCEAMRAHGESSAADIIATDMDGSGGLLVSTTTEHLAHRLGQALFQSFGGELHHGFGHGNKIAFVWWRGR